MKETSKRYSVKRWLSDASIEELEKWAADPNCDEFEICANLLIERGGERDKQSIIR